MLVFKEIREEELILDFLKKNDADLVEEITKNQIVFGGFDNNILFGICNVEIIEKQGDLKYIIITHNYRGRNLGNGLLRSTFSKLEKMNIDKIYYKNKNPFLLKKGFIITDNDNISISLKKLFNTSCDSQCGNCSK